MKETLHDAFGQDQTRVKRAFRWVVTFRDFPIGSRQTVDGDSMMTEALTLFTKGRAEFYLDGVRRGDRVPGILSSEYEPVGQGGTFELRYVEPTTRVCIPRKANGDKLPNVKKIMLKAGERFEVPSMARYLVCLGSVLIGEKTFVAEQSFQNGYMKPLMTLEDTILLEFL
jgi:hypothetical protein